MTALLDRGAAKVYGAALNVLSVLSWFSWPASAAYCAAKAAASSMTNSLRQELIGQGTQVTALHVSYMETGMARGVQGPKGAPADITVLYPALATEAG